MGDETTGPAADPARSVALGAAPLPVTLIGIRTEGTGAALVSGQEIVTPPGLPNLMIRVVTPLAAIAIRFANTYLTSLVGLVMTGMTTAAIPAPDFAHLVVKCASLALAGPAVMLAKDLITVLSGLERKFPLLTGSV